MLFPREREGHADILAELGARFRRSLGAPRRVLGGIGLEELGEVGADLRDVGYEGIGGAVFGGEGKASAGDAFTVTIVDGVVEERVESEVILLRERVKFVVVALGATDGEAEERTAKRGDAIHHRLDAELLGIDAALLVDLSVAIETGGNFLCGRGLREEIAGELFDDELVVGLILIQRGYDPVAVFPHLARRVDGVAVGIRVTRYIEPRAGPTFAVVGRSEQTLDEAGVGVGA